MRRQRIEPIWVAVFFLSVPFLLGQQQCPQLFPPPTNGGIPDGAAPAILAMEEDTLDLINQQRAANGVAALTMDEAVRGVARAHSQDMIDRNFFDHVNPDGLDPFDRLAAEGISFRTAGENIASNQGVADPAATAVTGWMTSPGHRANILNPNFTHTGMGIAVSDSGAHFFTQVFIGN